MSIYYVVVTFCDLLPKCPEIQYKRYNSDISKVLFSKFLILEVPEGYRRSCVKFEEPDGTSGKSDSEVGV